MRRRFVKSMRRTRVPVQWSSVAGAWTHAAITATTATTLINIENPVNLTGLTSDLPEDLIILRIVGSFSVVMTTAAANGHWTLALIVQDTTWTPGATFVIDADKRVLWHRSYRSSDEGGATQYSWHEPGHLTVVGAAAAFQSRSFAGDASRVDISPKVRIKPGQSLFLVAYENGGAVAFTTASTADMRVLYKRAGRR